MGVKTEFGVGAIASSNRTSPAILSVWCPGRCTYQNLQVVHLASCVARSRLCEAVSSILCHALRTRARRTSIDERKRFLERMVLSARHEAACPNTETVLSTVRAAGSATTLTLVHPTREGLFSLTQG